MARSKWVGQGRSTLGNPHFMNSASGYSEFIKIAFQIIDLMFAKIIIFWKSSSLCFISFPLVLTHSRKGTGQGRSALGNPHFLIPPICFFIYEHIPPFIPTKNNIDIIFFKNRNNILCFITTFTLKKQTFVFHKCQWIMSFYFYV